MWRRSAQSAQVVRRHTRIDAYTCRVFERCQSTFASASATPTPSHSAASRLIRPHSNKLITSLRDTDEWDSYPPIYSSSGASAPFSTASSASSSSSAYHLPSLSASDVPPMPPLDTRMLDCILVRHGESEGNIAYNRSWEGDHSLYTGAFLKRHSSLWRLTDRGREQAKTAGAWLREHIQQLRDVEGSSSPIYRYYVSEYIRAMETAALLELPDAKWFVEVQLRERDWGQFDILSQKERVVRFSEETRRRDRDSLFYAPPGGESLVHVLSRVDGVLTNFNRQCANKRCIVVCHGEVMWAFRLRFERLSQLTYREMEAASSPHERIHNCQILWYSRRNPYTGEVSKFFKWKRSVCPWDLARSKNEWEEIHRIEHTNDSLAAHVNRVKRIYGHEKSHREVQRQEETKQNPAHLPTDIPILPTHHDPSIAAELNSLKSEVPILAAAAATNLPKPIPQFATRSSEEKLATSDADVDVDEADEDGPQPAVNNPASLASLTPPPAASPLPPPTNSSSHSSHSSSSSQQPSQTPAVPKWSPAPGWPFLSAHPRVLVLTKTPRYEYEKNSSGLKGSDLHAELSKLGFVSDRLVQSYVRHMEGLAQLTSALQQHGMKVVVKHVDSATHTDLEGVDLILSAGGDGTMLKAAALLGFQERYQLSAQPAKLAPNEVGSASGTSSSSVSPADHHAVPSSTSAITAAAAATADADSIDPSSNPIIDVSSESAPTPGGESQPAAFAPIPLIGVNTDPQHSSGVLCAFSIEGPHTAERVIEHLRKSHFVWLEKSRIEITLLDKSGAVTLVPQYAYNDVVVAERDPGRPIVYELTIDEQPAEIQRSSGVLVCTGTGSTAWMSNAAAIHPDQVALVLKDIGQKPTPADARAIAERINMDLIFESNSPEVEYFIREPLLPSSSVTAIGRVGYQHRHGWAGRIAVRSLGWDAVMSIDGINLVPLPKGTTAVLQIGKKPGANLTVLSLAGSGGQPFSRQ